MYTKFFGFTRRPFELLPEPGFLYLTPQHGRAIANIRFALMNKDSFVIITGEVGIGKTTILNKITGDFPESFVVARLTHTTLSPVELIQAILSAFGIPLYKNKRVYLLDRLREFLIRLGDQGKYAVIMVDEAQNLRMDTLEELRLLSCIDGDDKKLLSTVLVGQSSLNGLIDSEELANLRDRTRLRQHLSALDAEATVDYVQHRIEVVDGKYDKIFGAGVAEAIFSASGGIPRRINTICDTALTAAFVEGKKTISPDTLEATLKELNFEFRHDGADRTVVLSPVDAVSKFGDQKAPIKPRTTEASKQVVFEKDGEPWAVVYHDGELQEVVNIGSLPYIIGRDATNSYAMDCLSVSRRHAIIVRTGDQFIIEDLGSTNGTIVNQEQISRHALAPGDAVTLGRFEFVFCPTEVPDENSLPNLGRS